MIIDYEGVVHVDSGLSDARTSNKPSSFTNFMHCPFEFTSDDFEVGLHEIQIPCSWKNVPDNQWAAAFSNDLCVSPMRAIAAGYYSISELIGYINGYFSHHGERAPNLMIDAKLGKVVSVCGLLGNTTGVHIRLTQALALMLGFSRRFGAFGTEPIEYDLSLSMREVTSSTPVVRVVDDNRVGDTIAATLPYCMQLAVPRLYVSCELVKHVAHSTRQLLRVIPASPNHRFGDILVQTYDRPLFLPLAHRSFDRISLTITDSSGKELTFLSGNVFATLEFRKKRDAFV